MNVVYLRSSCCEPAHYALNRTNKFFQNSVRAVGEGLGEKGGSSKKLMPYYPNAPRNRPKETVSITGSS